MAPIVRKAENCKVTAYRDGFPITVYLEADFSSGEAQKEIRLHGVEQLEAMQFCITQVLKKLEVK